VSPGNFFGTGEIGVADRGHDRVVTLAEHIQVPKRDRPAPTSPTLTVAPAGANWYWTPPLVSASVQSSRRPRTETAATRPPLDLQSVESPQARVHLERNVLDAAACRQAAGRRGAAALELRSAQRSRRRRKYSAWLSVLSFVRPAGPNASLLDVRGQIRHHDADVVDPAVHTGSRAGCSDRSRRRGAASDRVCGI
jgi:hypothetical protein